MQVSISSITIPPARSRTHRDLHQKFAPTWGFFILVFARGEFVGVAPERRAFVYERFLPFWNFQYNGKNWRLTTLWGLFVALNFICFLTNYSILDWSKAKKWKRFFWLKIENGKQFDCQEFDFESTLGYACMNNHIKEIFTALLTTDLWLSSI